MDRPGTEPSRSLGRQHCQGGRASSDRVQPARSATPPPPHVPLCRTFVPVLSVSRTGLPVGKLNDSYAKNEITTTGVCRRTGHLCERAIMLLPRSLQTHSPQVRDEHRRRDVDGKLNIGLLTSIRNPKTPKGQQCRNITLITVAMRMSASSL